MSQHLFPVCSTLVAQGTRLVLAATIFVLSACAADPIEQLERVAKDWSLTIRASQVIPVYPLSEDVQPGDVFLVPVSISEQTRIYQEKGFLPTDQLVTRLQSINYREFYGNAYWTGTYSQTPHARPTSQTSAVNAPRAAFPTYTFTVDRSGGLQLALPIQGIPVGLGLIGAARATGTVTLTDTFTYGTDGETVYGALLAWYGSHQKIRETLGAMANSTDAEIYLRIVTRVYLVTKIDVSLANIESLSGGADVGAAQEVNLPDLSSENPAEVAAATDAYKTALEGLSSVLNTDALGAPGGSVRFTQLDRRTVSLSQPFDRPLVIGFVGFDVKVLKSGLLSAPIPSFSVLAGDIPSQAFEPIEFAGDDELVRAYLSWLTCPGNRDLMVAFLESKNVPYDPTDLASDRQLRWALEAAQEEFDFLATQGRCP